MRRLRGGSSSIAMSLKRWIPSLEWDAARTKTYLGAQYRRLARRIGANRAPMAVAHSIAVMLSAVKRSEASPDQPTLKVRRCFGYASA